MVMPASHILRVATIYQSVDPAQCRESINSEDVYRPTTSGVHRFRSAHEKYFTACSLEELFESADNRLYQINQFL